jgi:hypothetical protein
MPRGRVCRLLGISEATFYRDQAEALRTIVGTVYEWGRDETEGVA